MMTTNRHLSNRGWISPPAGHHRYSGEFLLYAIAYLVLLLRHDVDLRSLTGSALLVWMR
jgi:hypothetical protein